MFEADVNRDPEQYTETSDKRYAEMISYLVDVLLLHQRALFPSEDPSIDKRVIMEWSLVGRAMLGNIPMISELPSIALQEITDPDNSIQKK